VALRRAVILFFGGFFIPPSYQGSLNEPVPHVVFGIIGDIRTHCVCS
jgi:hypothetical protein